jgi:pSer/pThr/pTyr-binding forkhead associated (FHA) protein
MPVMDLGSRNGTLLNGSPLTGQARLRGGDVLKLGWARLVVQQAQPAGARRPTAVAMPRQIILSDDQRELARALVAPFRGLGPTPARPPKPAPS